MEENQNIYKIISFILLLISICFNFKEWVYDYKIFGYKVFSEEINIKPSLITTFISILLFGGYILRNKKDILSDSIKILFSIFDLLFFSGFIAMFANGDTNILGFSSQSVLFFTVVLIYIGINSFLRYIILIFIASSFLFISKVNQAMGIWGSIYILCAFASFVIQIYTNILPEIEFNKNDFFPEKEKKEKDNNNNYQLLSSEEKNL